MKKILVLMLIIVVLSISACIKEAQTKYVCPDGKIVSDANLCKITSKPTTSNQLTERCDHQSYWSSDSIPISPEQCLITIQSHSPKYERCTVQTISELPLKERDYLKSQGFQKEVSCYCCYDY